MPEERNGKTYSFDVCSECKHTCCKDANPPLITKRIDILASHIQKEKILIQDGNFLKVEEYSHPASDSEGLCVFYDKQTQKCKVHQVKPESCRAGPITFDINLRTEKVEFYLKRAKICPFAGVLFANKKLLEPHLNAAKLEIMRLISDLDARALKTILQIPEPDTFKIAENDLPKEIVLKLQIS